jgi:hypothetical protein
MNATAFRANGGKWQLPLDNFFIPREVFPILYHAEQEALDLQHFSFGGPLIVCCNELSHSYFYYAAERHPAHMRTVGEMVRAL